MFNHVALISIVFSILLSACASRQTLPPASVKASVTQSVTDYQYVIGPNDVLNVFVWRNPEVSGNFSVRPDGKISTPLVSDIQVTGKKTSEVAEYIAKELAQYIRDPKVTVSVTQFVGPYSEQVRVIGEATNPIAVNFREHMTLLDLMIEVGGLTEYADGNGAVLIRVVNGKRTEYSLKINTLIKDGDIAANVDLLPGDVIIIPEAWF
jgi:polysaccharide export outer membrane protein